MTEPETLLKMIETVSNSIASKPVGSSFDPDDTAKLDEIDARVWCFLYGFDFGWINPSEFHDRVSFTHLGPVQPDDRYIEHCRMFTRSRDALKSIRPKNWRFTTSVQTDSYYPSYRPSGLTTASHPVTTVMLKSPCTTNTILATEELAELHAIIQAIDYERKQQNKDMT